jgi:hypothetical protein
VNKFLYACDKEVCCLWAQPSFVLQNTKKIVQSKRCGMLISSVVLLHDNAYLHTAAHTRALQELFNRELFDHPLYSPDLGLSDTTCLLVPTWKIGCNYSASTIMSWWKVPKLGWAHRQQNSLTQAYKNLIPDMTSALILPMIMLKSSLSMYVFFVYKHFFLISCFVNSLLEVTFWIALIF